MYKIGMCGHFGGDKNFLDGQTIKTKSVAKELEKKLGIKNIKKIDTYNWKKAPFKLLRNSFLLIKRSENILILPAHNGLKVFVPLFSFFNLFFKKNLHYIVIGGWLYNYLQEKKYLIKYLKKFKGIYVETKGMKLNLNNLGLKNIYVMSNFKELNKVSENDIKLEKSEKFKFCTFSRVTAEKGITDSINLVKALNKEGLKCKLDIYGQIENNYREIFENLININKEFIEYKGIIDFNKSVDVLKDYDCLLFLTKYKGEGFPGTLIDALYSALPVIASDWKYNKEIIVKGQTGFMYDLGDSNKLMDISRKLILKNYDIYEIRKNCLKYAENFKGEKIIEILINNL